MKSLILLSLQFLLFTNPIFATDANQPTINLGADLNSDEYLNVSNIIGNSVDTYLHQSELTKTRTQVNSNQSDNVDKCASDNAPHDQFSDQISYYTQMMIKDVPAMVGMIGSYYATSENDSNYFPTSLIRHPLCNVSLATLKQTIKNVPSQNTINKLNTFANNVNSLRSDVLKGDMKAKVELLRLWSRFFSCLAYTESLATADGAMSKKVAASFAPKEYRRPAGVEFYEDRKQPIESRLNIGTFQFTPDKNGNIAPCIKAWNKMNPGQNCQVPLNGSQTDLIKILGSSFQSFNDFCGVHKLIETFSIQVNTKSINSTHPSNLINGQLKNAEARCVSPHFQAGKAYNHFGPFQNSTGSNLDELFDCTLGSQN